MERRRADPDGRALGDVDMAQETVQFMKFPRQQAGTAMLAQANQSTHNVLSLLR